MAGEDGWTDGRMDGQMDRWTEGRMDGQMDGWMKGQTENSPYVFYRASIEAG